MNYRKDIQVLRGVAVFSVLTFHLFPTVLPNGFLGVDVFFVISGFLMANLYRLDDPGRNYKKFLKRRLKRIFPAYVGTLLAFLFIGMFVFSPYDFFNSVKQAVSGVLLVPNFYFWRSEGYFEAINFQPFIHYWSLGVELQFYVIVPFLTLLFSKSKAWILATFLASLGLCLVMLTISVDSAFFLLPFRIWEFISGYIIVYLLKEKEKENRSRFLFFISLFLLLVCLIGSWDFQPHPGSGALLVCILTASLIYFNPSNEIIKSPCFTFLEKIGTYSYSLYLVHMPLIALIWYEPLSSVTHDVPLDEKLIVYLVTCTVLTYLSFKIFESGSILQYKINKEAVFYKALMPSLLILILLGPMVNSHIYGEHYRNITFAKEDTLPWRCGPTFKINSFISGEKSCLLSGNENDSQKVLLVGDSHADSLKHGLKESLDNTGHALYLFNNSCLPGARRCSLDSISKEIEEKNITKVIVHGLHYNIRYDKLETLVHRVNSEVRFYFVKPVPIYSLDKKIPKYLFEMNVKSQEYRLSDLDEMSEKYSKYKVGYQKILDSGYVLIETIDVFCSPGCLVMKKGKPLYYDNHHLTMTGSEFLIDRLREVITGR